MPRKVKGSEEINLMGKCIILLALVNFLCREMKLCSISHE